MFSVKGQTGFGGHVVSVITPSCHCSAKAATDNKQVYLCFKSALWTLQVSCKEVLFVFVCVFFNDLKT